MAELTVALPDDLLARVAEHAGPRSEDEIIAESLTSWCMGRELSAHALSAFGSLLARYELPEAGTLPDNVVPLRR